MNYKFAIGQRWTTGVRDAEVFDVRDDGNEGRLRLLDDGTETGWEHVRLFLDAGVWKFKSPPPPQHIE